MRAEAQEGKANGKQTESKRDQKRTEAKEGRQKGKAPKRKLGKRGLVSVLAAANPACRDAPQAYDVAAGCVTTQSRTTIHPLGKMASMSPRFKPAAPPRWPGASKLL